MNKDGTIIENAIVHGLNLNYSVSQILNRFYLSEGRETTLCKLAIRH